MSNPDFTRINTDVLIIGAGGAGLRAASLQLWET